MNDSILIKFAVLPLYISKTNIEFDSNQPSCSSQNSDQCPVKLIIEFKMKHSLFPVKSKDPNQEIYLYIPPEINNISESQEIDIQFSGQFIYFCSTYNKFRVMKLKDPLDNIHSVDRFVIVIFCDQYNLNYQESDRNYSLQIKGFLQPREIKETDRLIIELRQKSVDGSFNLTTLFQTSEDSSFLEQEKNIWSFNLKTVRQFKQVQFLPQYSNSCEVSQQQLQFKNKISSKLEIYDLDKLYIEFEKQGFEYISDKNQDPLSLTITPFMKNIECTAQSLQGIVLEDLLQNCQIIESIEFYIIYLSFKMQQNILQTWNRKDIILEFKSINLIPKYRNDVFQIRYKLISANDGILSTSITFIEQNNELIKDYFKISTIDLFAPSLNQMNNTIQSLNSQNYNTLALELKINITQIPILEYEASLVLDIDKKLSILLTTRISVDICNSKNNILQSSLENSNQRIVIKNFGLQLSQLNFSQFSPFVNQLLYILILPLLLLTPYTC